MKNVLLAVAFTLRDIVTAPVKEVGATLLIGWAIISGAMTLVTIIFAGSYALGKFGPSGHVGSDSFGEFMDPYGDFAGVYWKIFIVASFLTWLLVGVGLFYRRYEEHREEIDNRE